MALIQKRIPWSQKPDQFVGLESPRPFQVYLLLNEATGFTAKSATNKHNCSLSSDITWTVLGGRRAVRFVDNTATAGTIPNHPDLQITGDLFITCRVRFNSAAAGRNTITVKRINDTNREFEFRVNFGTGGDLEFIDNNSEGIESANTNLSLGVDYTLSVVRDTKAGRVQMYVDGSQVYDAARTATPVATTANIAVGGRVGDSGFSINGWVSHLDIGNFAPTSEYVKQHHENLYRDLKPRRRWVPFSAAAGTTFNQAVSGSITPSGTLATALTIAQSLAGSITSTGALTFITSFKQTLTGSISSTGNLSRKISTSFEGSITSTGSVLKKTIRVLAGSITSTGALASELSSDILKTVTGSITATGTLTKKVFRSLSGSISSTGAITKKTSIDLDGSIGMSGDPDKGMAQDTSGSITPTGDLTASAPFVPAPDEGGGPGPDGSLAQRIRRVYGKFKRSSFR